MEILFVILAFVLLLVGMLGAFIPGLPGPPLSYMGLLLLQLSGFGTFSKTFLWIWLGVTVALTLMDYLLPSLLTKKFGGSRAASIGAFLGVLAGIFIFPPWGIIFGSFVGALAGELIHNSSDGTKALKVAFGAFLSFIVGTGAKLIASSMMLFYAVRALF
ncbi:MAG: DUF456 domain-containing protein [Treponema sp.]|nr:DUF456 domain-containing protein [Treponema sp.]